MRLRGYGFVAMASPKPRAPTAPGSLFHSSIPWRHASNCSLGRQAELGGRGDDVGGIEPVEDEGVEKGHVRGAAEVVEGAGRADVRESGVQKGAL